MKKIIIFLLVALGLSACSKTGSIKISTKQNLQTRTVVPDIDMNIADYVVSGVNNEHSFMQVTTENNVVVDNLALGEWTVIVDARNAEAAIIGRGSGITTVYNNNQSQLNITVIPLTGNGNIAVNMTWDTTVDNVVAVGKLMKSGQEDIEFNLNIEQPNRIATYSNTLSAGYYFLTLNLLMDNVDIGGAMESVRIIEGVLTQVNVGIVVNLGVAGITINADMGDPIEIDLSGALDLLPHGESMLVKATPVNCSLDNTTCYFFINGNLAYETTTPVDGGFEFSVTDLSLGTHRLDVAIRKDGLVTQMGNVSHIFIVEGLALLAPYDVNAEAVSHDTINVSWRQDNISVVDGWEIDRKQGVDGAWVHIATIPKDSLIAYEKKIIDLHMAYLHRKACLYAKSY